MVPDPKILDAVLQGQLKARRATSGPTLEVSDDLRAIYARDGHGRRAASEFESV